MTIIETKRVYESTLDFGLEVAKGKVPGHKIINNQ